MARSFTIPSIFTAIDKVSGVVKGMGRNVEAFANKAEAGISRADRFINKLTPGFSSAAKQVLSFASAAAIAGAIVSGVVFSFQSLKDYEVAVQSFRTIVSDLSDKDFAKYQQKIREVAIATKKSSIDVAKAFEMIAGLNAEFAKTPEAIGAVSAAAILLSKASRDELGKSASNLTGILNQFNLAADQSNRVVNVLAAGQAVGASSITQTADAFTVFGAVAKNANLTLEQSTALVEVLASKQIQGAEAGTALRGSLLALQKAGLGYKSGVFSTRDALVEFNEKLSKLTTAKKRDAYFEKVFGVINRTTGTILAQNIELYDKFTTAVTGTTEANKAAEINSNSLTNRLGELRAKWVTLITTSAKSGSTMDKVTKAVVYLTDNMETVIGVTATFVAGYIALRAILIAGRAALFAYNIYLGIYTALTGRATVFTAAQTVAMNAQLVTTRLITAAQWAWNAAMTANPIGLVIVAIAAMIAVIVVVIQKWNEWGAALSFFLGPLGLIISLVQSFRRNWDMITKSFKEGGIVAGLKAIGKTLLDVILMPMQQIAKLLAQWTGIEAFANAEKLIAFARRQLEVNIATDENGQPIDTPVLNPERERREALRETITTQRQNVAIDIRDQTGRAKMETDNNLVPVRLSSTMGWSNF